ncbi:MAG: hypothetical protein NT053_15280 [Cyanobacteria bacterium]|nr:hypothetical protein [Cyanobacteriota bacterium]
MFIGMAPGVGKTCRMLQEGQERCASPPPRSPSGCCGGGPGWRPPSMHPLLVLTVLDSHRLLSRDEGLRMEQCEQLCARSRRITQIVLGQSRATSLAGLLLRPLSE